MNKKIVVITGCLGFIGQYIARVCLNKGWIVYGVDKMTYAASKERLNEFCFNPNFSFIKEDICKLDRLPDCDYVINLAAESHVGNSIVSNEDFVQTNVEGVRNLLELIRNKPLNAYGRPHLLHFSTDEVYGDIRVSDYAFSESEHLNPSNPYSASKAAADMLIFAWARTYGIEYNIIRPTNNYGIGQFPEKLIPLSVKILQSGKKIALHDGGEPFRSWLHAEDTAKAVLTILENGEKNNIYNVGGVEKKNKEVVRKILKEFNKQANTMLEWDDVVDITYKREGQDVRYSVEDYKLRMLGWEPEKDFNIELPKIVANCIKTFRW